MENLQVNNEQFKAHEKIGNSKLKALLMAASVAVMSVLGACNKPDSLDVCLGEEQAKEHKSRLSERKETCHERVEDYVKSKDGDMRATLRDDANHACGSYKDELKVTKALIRAKWDSARRQKEWDKRDKCTVARKVVENRMAVLEEGDLHKLETE